MLIISEICNSLVRLDVQQSPFYYTEGAGISRLLPGKKREGGEVFRFRLKWRRFAG